jgi:hypothetical protein
MIYYRKIRYGCDTVTRRCGTAQSTAYTGRDSVYPALADAHSEPLQFFPPECCALGSGKDCARASFDLATFRNKSTGRAKNRSKFLAIGFWHFLQL